MRRKRRIRGGVSPKKLVNFFTRFGLVRFGGSGSTVLLLLLLLVDAVLRCKFCERMAWVRLWSACKYKWYGKLIYYIHYFWIRLIRCCRCRCRCRFRCRCRCRFRRRLYKVNYLNVVNSSRSFSNSCVTKCCERISDERWATLRASVTTCDSSLWNRLFIPYFKYRLGVSLFLIADVHEHIKYPKLYRRFTLISLIFRRSSIRLRSRIGRPLIELDGSDERLPWRRRMPAPRARNDSCKRPGKLLRVPSIFYEEEQRKMFEYEIGFAQHELHN